jgi:hypothetical protein
MSLDGIYNNLSFHLRKVFEYKLDAVSSDGSHAVAEIHDLHIDPNGRVILSDEIDQAGHGFARGLQPFPVGDCVLRGGRPNQGSGIQTGTAFLGLTLKSQGDFTNADADKYVGVSFGSILATRTCSIWYRGLIVTTYYLLKPHGDWFIRRRDNTFVISWSDEVAAGTNEVMLHEFDLAEFGHEDEKFYPVVHMGAGIILDHVALSSTLINRPLEAMSIGASSLSPNPALPYQLSVGFRSANTARFFGFLSSVLADNASLTVAGGTIAEVRPPLPQAVSSAFESIMLLCDQPFHIDTYSVSDLFDKTPSGRLSVVGTITPNGPSNLPITWSAHEHVWVPIRNRDPIITRRFLFRIVHRDFSPVEMNGQTVFTILIRGNPPKRPSNACNRDL